MSTTSDCGPNSTIGKTPNISVQEATTSEIDSMTTILARSFHPVNPFITKVYPDTPLMRGWFTTMYNDEINNIGISHPIVAIDTTTGSVVGILALRLMGADERGSGMWTNRSLCDDHQAEMHKDMCDSMTSHRERLMLGRSHFLIQLFGVDHAYKGQHLGKRLLLRAFEIADQAGLEVFVQANASARGMYLKHGFEEREVVVMPGDLKYTEHMLTRACTVPERKSANVSGGGP
jgi:GNAT superfamily N-acetyltransferase